MEGGLLLNVIIAEGATVLKLLSSEDQPLLVWGNTLLVLDLGLHVLNGVGRFDLEGDGLSSEGLNEDLHSSTETQNQMESALLLDVVVAESPTVLELLPGEDQPLLVWGNTLLVLNKEMSNERLDYASKMSAYLNLCLHVLDRVRGLHLEGDGLAS